MSFARLLKSTTALLGTLAMLANTTVAFADDRGRGGEGFSNHDGVGDHEDFDHDELSLREKIDLLRHKVKYVFVIFHENESFDH